MKFKPLRELTTTVRELQAGSLTCVQVMEETI